MCDHTIKLPSEHYHQFSIPRGITPLIYTNEMEIGDSVTFVDKDHGNTITKKIAYKHPFMKEGRQWYEYALVMEEDYPAVTHTDEEPEPEPKVDPLCCEVFDRMELCDGKLALSICSQNGTIRMDINTEDNTIELTTKDLFMIREWIDRRARI